MYGVHRERQGRKRGGPIMERYRNKEVGSGGFREGDGREEEEEGSVEEERM
jgi:hypothetical protein